MSCALILVPVPRRWTASSQRSSAIDRAVCNPLRTSLDGTKCMTVSMNGAPSGLDGWEARAAATATAMAPACPSGWACVTMADCCASATARSRSSAKVRAERSDAHGGSVAERALAEQCGRRLTPVFAACQLMQQFHCACAVPAKGVLTKAPHERGRQDIRIDPLPRCENLHDRQRHVGVVGPRPGTVRQGRSRVQVVNAEMQLAECVACGEAFEAPKRAGERVIHTRPQTHRGITLQRRVD